MTFGTGHRTLALTCCRKRERSGHWRQAAAVLDAVFGGQGHPRRPQLHGCTEVLLLTTMCNTPTLCLTMPSPPSERWPLPASERRLQVLSHSEYHVLTPVPCHDLHANGLPTICQAECVTFFAPSTRPAYNEFGWHHSPYDDAAWPSGYAGVGHQYCVRPGHAAAPSPATPHTHC